MAKNLQKKREEENLRAQWKERDRQLWARIDAVIKVEEDRLRAKQEAERKKREEEERKRKASQPKTKRKPFNFEQVCPHHLYRTQFVTCSC